jgi:hypothetical protein
MVLRLVAPIALAALLFAAGQTKAADDKPPPAGGFFGTFEGHYLSNLGEKTQWGTLFESLNPFVSTANLSVLPKWGGGGRVGLGYRAASGWDVVALGDADWLYSGNQQFIVPGSQRLAFSLTPPPPLTPPNSAVVFPANSQVSADAQTAYSYVDLEGGYNWKLGTIFDVRLFGGARYANFDQDIQTTGSTSNFVPFGLPAEIDSRREVTYWGVGPRLGGSGRMRICESPFYLISSVSGSVLFGQMKVQDQDSLSAGTSINVETDRNKMYTARTAYNGEGEVGVLYDVSPILQGLDVTVGYRIAGWFGVNDTRPANNFNPSGESHANVVTQGTFLRINVRY